MIYPMPLVSTLGSPFPLALRLTKTIDLKKNLKLRQENIMLLLYVHLEKLVPEKVYHFLDDLARETGFKRTGWLALK